MKEQFRQKRNKPCEHCRAHRRKCVNYDNLACERCYKLQLNCVFQYTEKPAKSLNPTTVSNAKFSKLFETIWTLQAEIEEVQLQLSQFRIADTIAGGSNDKGSNNSSNTCQCINSKLCNHKTALLPNSSTSQWRLSILNSRGRISLQTSVHTVTDLYSFIQEVYSFFKLRHVDGFERPNGFSSNTAGSQHLSVTYRLLEGEDTIRETFSTDEKTEINIKVSDSTDDFDSICINNDTQEIPNEIFLDLSMQSKDKLQMEYRTVKLLMIKNYFRCIGLLDPYLTYSYYYPLATDNLDSLLASSIAAWTALSHCCHVDMTGHSFSRSYFADRALKEAKELLKDALFDEEPTLELCFSLVTLVHCYLSILQIKEARVLSSIAWRTIIQLKPVYSSNLKKPQTTLEMTKSETYTRLFCIIRFLELYLHIAYDKGKRLSSIMHDSDIALPSPLPWEKIDSNLNTAVTCFHYEALLMTNSAAMVRDNTIELLGLQLIASTIDAISSSAIQYLENALLSIGNQIPPELHLANGPYQYIQENDKRIQQCHDPYILKLNLTYYIYWMNLQTRVMNQPSKTDLAGAAFERVDGDRAVLVASIATEIASRLFIQMAKVQLCSLDAHWLLMCTGAAQLLATSANKSIKQKAIVSLEKLEETSRLKCALVGTEKTNPFASDAPYLKMTKGTLKNLFKNKPTAL